MEGMCKDADGMMMSVMLHTDVKGFMSMLEIYKYDLSPIINPPCARDLVLLLPEDPGRKPGKRWSDSMNSERGTEKYEMHRTAYL